VNLTDTQARDWIRQAVRKASYEKREELWDVILAELGTRRGARLLCLEDRYYLLTVALNRPDMKHPWLYARCREVEAAPDGFLDLWAREHGKSSIITFAGSIQEVLRDPEITIGIFSHTAPDAKKFVTQIKNELETNRILRVLFPEILWDDPTNDAPLWSAEKGIIVKRASNPREATVEGHGVVDSQPTGSHFRLMIFDDLVTALSVSTPEQVKKTTDMHALADNLGARGTDGLIRKWHIGTRYHFRDTYQELLDRGSLIPRIYPATDDGTRDGNPVLLTPEAWEIKKRDMPSHILAAQMLQNPAAGNEAMFKKEWLRWTEIRPATLNVAILVDPASSKKRSADSTVIHVWGVDTARNRYLLDGYHHKMSLSERWTALLNLYKRWTGEPGIQLVKVGYERYGATSDLEYFREKMEQMRFYFSIEELNWPRDSDERSKLDRIQRLEPDFRNGKIHFPFQNKIDGKASRELTKLQEQLVRESRAFQILQPTVRQDENGNLYRLHIRLTEEYLVYPFAPHDDGLDCASRWCDMDMHPPQIIDDRAIEPEVFVDGA
jgi:hypothetical protein